MITLVVSITKLAVKNVQRVIHIRQTPKYISILRLGRFQTIKMRSGNFPNVTTRFGKIQRPKL